MKNYYFDSRRVCISNPYLRAAVVVVLACIYALMLYAYLYCNPVREASAVTEKPKNVIMIQTDHELSYLHGTEDDTYGIFRPNYDAFRAQSVDFVNAKSINPLCSPARRTMLTAQYPHQHGIITNSTAIAPNPNVDTIYDVLLENGFGSENIYFYGKTHWSGSIANDTPQTAYGVQGWSTAGYGQPYKTQKYKDYLQKNNYFESDEREPVMTLVAQPLTINPVLKAGDEFNIANMGIITGNYFGIMKAPKEFHEAYFLADMVNDQLKELAASDRDEPFVMSVNMWGPHHPYYPTQEFVDLYTDENGVIGGNIPEYPSYRDTFENKPKVYAWDNAWANSYPNLPVPNAKSWEEFRIYMAMAYAQATLVDAAIGTILDTIDETGLVENTVVIWTADHGDALGSHGGHLDKNCYLSEELIRIPLLVRAPGAGCGAVSAANVSNLDIPATIADYCGERFRTEIDAQSLRPYLEDAGSAGREYFVSVSHGHFQRHIARAVCAGRYRYIYNKNMTEELYDLETDPYELHNLCNDPAYADIKKRLQEKLDCWRKEYRDREL